VEVEAVLHLHGHRSAERVQTKHRVVALQRQPIDSELRDKIPVHRVAESLVDPHAVLVDGETLGNAGNRRSLKAAIGEIGLKLAAIFLIDIDLREVASGSARHQIVLAVLPQLSCTQALDVGRDLIDIDAAARQGRDADNLDARQSDGGGRGGLVRRLSLRKRNRAGQADQTGREQTCSCDAEDIPPGYSRSTIQGPIRRATPRLLQWRGFPILPR